MWYAWDGGVIPVMTKADLETRYQQCLARIHACDAARATATAALKKPVRFTVGVRTYEADYVRAPDDLVMLRAYNMMESSYTVDFQSFTAVFKYMADCKGYGVLYGDGDLEEIDQVEGILRRAKRATA